MTDDVLIEQLRDPAYQRFANFHALYLSLCLQHGHTVHIPTVLARIYAPKLATLAWDKPAATAPDSLSDVEHEFIEVRRQPPLRRLGAQLITGRRDEDRNDSRSAPPTFSFCKFLQTPSNAKTFPHIITEELL